MARFDSDYCKTTPYPQKLILRVVPAGRSDRAFIACRSAARTRVSPFRDQSGDNCQWRSPFITITLPLRLSYAQSRHS